VPLLVAPPHHRAIREAVSGTCCVVAAVIFKVR